MAVGGSPLNVPGATKICFGGANIGNLYAPVDDDQAHEAVAAAWNGGIRYFDTAPHYGLGLSERRLGRALRNYPRDQYVLSTKVGRLLVPNGATNTGTDQQGFAVPATHTRVWDFSRDGIRRSVEDSLERLGLDRIDMLFLHDPDEHWQEAIDHGYPALAELRDEGVVTAIGAGMNQTEMLAAFVGQTDMDIVMVAGRYTLLDQTALDELLPLCLERNVGVVNAGVFNSGILSKPKPHIGMTYDYHRAPTDLVQRAIEIATICERHGTSLPICAIQFGASHPAIVSTAMGANSAERVQQNLSMFRSPIPHAVWTELIARALLRPDTPLPT